jgi:AcrR family transcriptional regulator
VATPDIIRAARDMLPNPGHSITSIARLLGVSPGTLYNHIPDLRELRPATGRPVRAQIIGPGR